jgi:hypothetical protein
VAIRYFPKIRDALQHEFLQEKIKGYPTHSYDEWCRFQEKEIANFRIANRGEAWLVPFTYHEFSEYARDNRRTHDFDTFKDFIFWKGSTKPEGNTS